MIFEDVRIFNGTSDRLSARSNVPVAGNVIKTISSAPVVVPPATSVQRIAGGARTLMPGLIDVHTHLMFATVSQQAVLASDIRFVNVAAIRAANDMLMRAFTSVRDKMATADNAELLALSGLRSPYAGKLGVVREGALADLLLVDGDPLEDIKRIEEPARNFLVIMKDGRVYKNALP